MARKVRAVRLLVLDVDGVLTDGSIIYDDAGLETKAFNVKDGHGIKLLRRAGLEAAVITARTSRVVELRAADLSIEMLFQGATDKRAAFAELLERTGLSAAETAYVGDDVVDLPVLSRAGFSVAVADAVAEVKERVHYVTSLPGGRGAVREVCELILKTQGRWKTLMSRYLD
ncbi:MAG TPA: HAD-IIIA family hydrolase [Deltaproteobacteria bacterium]|nr:HAD-IIIA family hydrolase [Deltaproteobacteria bacterium]